LNGRSRRAEHMTVVVAYDISSDRRRTKIEKLLKDYGQRVNYSVFECDIERKFYPELRRRASSLINKKEDRLLFYPLCLECLKKRDCAGRTEPVIREEIINL